jgi:hypothetical protein
VAEWSKASSRKGASVLARGLAGGTHTGGF